MPKLDRQPSRAGARTALRVPETEPTPLQRHYITLSFPALIAGFIGITAVETGTPVQSLLVKACVVIAVPLLLLANGDATLRIWRSAWAWMPVDRGLGVFRLAWTAAAVLLLLVIAAVAVVVLLA
jgi:hypothetical protein